MENTIIGFILSVIKATGNLLLGIGAVVGIYKYFRNMAVTNEILYGEEAEERLNDLKYRLNKCSSFKLNTVKYGGSEKLKTPKLEIRKLSAYSKIMSKEWKKYRAIIKYYHEDSSNGEKIIKVKRWLI